jgi:hypothetical protein
MESEKLSSLESIQKSTEVKRKYTYTPKRNRELRKSHYDRLHEIETYLQNVIYRQESIIRLRDKLSNAKRHNSPLRRTTTQEF